MIFYAKNNTAYALAQGVARGEPGARDREKEAVMLANELLKEALKKGVAGAEKADILDTYAFVQLAFETSKRQPNLEIIRDAYERLQEALSIVHNLSGMSQQERHLIETVRAHHRFADGILRAKRD